MRWRWPPENSPGKRSAMSMVSPLMVRSCSTRAGSSSAGTTLCTRSISAMVSYTDIRGLREE